MADLKEAADLTQKEMKAFLNNDEDFEEFEFYEETMGERMMLSSMDQKLASSDMALTDVAYRDLLGMMHEERRNFSFSSDLHDQENMDMSPARFSKQNLEHFGQDMDRLNQNMFSRAERMLTPEQLKAFIESVTATADMQKAQLEMAAQMFGGGQ